MSFEEMTKWVDEGSPVGPALNINYLDFQKLKHLTKYHIKDELSEYLKLKPHGYGISIIKWIEQWLSDGRQRVVVDGEVSNWKSVLSGVSPTHKVMQAY